MAFARARRTFRLGDSDSESEDSNARGVELDEEEQEKVITDFRTQDEAKNRFYTLLFTIFPLVASGSLLPTLLSPSSPANHRILSLLGITSLGSTAYICKFIPATTSQPLSASRAVTPASFSDFNPSSDGPIEKFLIPLTSIMSLLLFFAAWGLKGRQSVNEEFWMLCGMPAVVFWVVMVARRVMGSTGVGIRELESKRYGFKGA